MVVARWATGHKVDHCGGEVGTYCGWTGLNWLMLVMAAADSPEKRIETPQIELTNTQIEIES